MLKRAEGRPPVRCISDRAHMRRRRQARRLLEKKYSYLSIDSMSVCMKSCPYLICWECVQFKIEIRNISRSGLSCQKKLGIAISRCRFAENAAKQERCIMCVEIYCSTY